MIGHIQKDWRAPQASDQNLHSSKVADRTDKKCKKDIVKAQEGSSILNSP